MQPLRHQELQELTGLLQTLVDVYGSYNDQKPELHRSLLALLDRSAAMYRERGRPQRESHTASLKAELATALRGINPITLEKTALRRHEMQNTIAFKALQSLESELRESFQEADASLQQAEALVGQIIVAGIQKGMIGEADIRDTTTQEAIDALWRSLVADADLRLAQKRVLLIVSAYDVSLLIDKVLTGFRTQLT